MGRPAYKTEIEHEAEYWELPACFIIEYSIKSAKRIFPFDSGAFGRGIMPPFISMMGMEKFELTGIQSVVQKVIGTYFGSTSNYYRKKLRDPGEFETKYNLDILDQEARALHKLYALSTKAPDDRRAAIEVQFDSSVELTPKNVLAVIFPEEYVRSRAVMNYIEKDLKAIPITYPIYPLSISYYYSAIYEKVEQFYKKVGAL